MQYLITFLEGIISFISPCMLPMIPLYISYFSGDNKDNRRKTILSSIAFVIGFTVVFCILGLFAGTIGQVLTKYKRIVNLICGIIIILFGLTYLDFIKIPFFKGMKKKEKVTGVFSAFIFGIIFSINLTPCIGAFLGSALMMASSSQNMIEGVLLLLVYSLGLGIPFILSAVLLDKLKNTFNFIKKHYKVINVVCGVFLIIIGILMAFGILSTFLNRLR